MLEIKPHPITKIVFALMSLSSFTVVLFALTGSMGADSNQKLITAIVFSILAFSTFYGALFYAKARIIVNKDILNARGLFSERSVNLSQLTSAKVFYSRNGLNLELADTSKVLTLAVSSYGKEDSSRLLVKIKPFILSENVEKSKNIVKIFSK